MIRVAAVIVLLFVAADASAQKKRERFADVVPRVEARFEPAEAKPGDTVVWKLTIELKPGWHTYPTRQATPGASEVIEIAFPTVEALAAKGEITDPPGAGTIPNPEGGLPLAVYDGTVTFEQKFVVTPRAANGPFTFTVPTRLLACDDNHCLPPEKVVTTATLTVAGASDQAVAPPQPPPAGPTTTEAPGSPTDASAYAALMQRLAESIDRERAPRHSGLIPFLLQAALWGGISLLTPCVFPMIPITVSYFLKQSEKAHRSPLLLASIYCATIVVVLGGASLTLLSFFTALSINPWMNVFLGSLFVLLAMSLFGLFELTLPASLTRFTATRESQGGYVGTVFMALTFTIVSFTCVAPFLGGFGGMAASGQFATYELILGALAFACTFAAPFFLLALFPSLIRKLPKSGGWLHVVKVVMGFIELAAALKFFRTAELVLFREATILTYELTLALWVALCVGCSFYLLKLFQVGEHEAVEDRNVGVPRLLWALGFLALALYIAPALFRGGPEGLSQRPGGTVFAWIDSFILPDTPPDAAHGELAWTGDLAKAIDTARTRGGHVFVDFTGETCTNCKLNERNVFVRPEVKDLFKSYQLVQLYTDKVPERFYSPSVRSKLTGTERQRADAEVNRAFQDQVFGSVQLPLYAILKPGPDGRTRIVGAYDEAKISNVAGFVEFLRKPLN